MASAVITPCIRCLTVTGPLICLQTCVHSEILAKTIDSYSMDLSATYLCVLCHSLLKKATIFTNEVEENCKLLAQYVNEYNKEIISQCLSQTKPVSLNISPVSYLAIGDDCDDNDDDEDLEGMVECETRPIQDIKVKAEQAIKKENFINKIGTDNKCPKPKRKTKKAKKYDDKVTKITLTKEELMEERDKELNSENFLKFIHKCKKCIVGYDFKETLDEHMIKHNQENGDLVCEVCERVFSHKNSYYIHCYRHFTRYQCVLCKYRLMDRDTMLKHYTDAHDSNSITEFTCELCGFVTSSKRAYRYHKEKHVSRTQCHHCQKYFSNKSSVRHHILKVHAEKKTVYKCEECDKTYKGKSGLTTHKLSYHSKELPVKCNSCNVQFKNLYNYQHHLKTHSKHTSVKDRKFECDICNERFVYQRSLKDHKDFVHLQNYKHVCLVCNTKYRALRGLERHRKIVHEKQKPPKNMICQYCGKAFSNSFTLKSHIHTHTGDRPLSCTECTSTFKQPAALYRHKKQLHPNS